MTSLICGWLGEAKVSCILSRSTDIGYVWARPDVLAAGKGTHYENKPIQIYSKFYHQKNENF